MSIWADKARALEQNAAALVAKTTADAKAIRDALCPVDTGALLASGHIEQIGPYEADLVEGTGLGDARAVFTERGTVHMAARPHVTPAFEAQRQTFNAGMRRLFG